MRVLPLVSCVVRDHLKAMLVAFPVVDTCVMHSAAPCEVYHAMHHDVPLACTVLAQACPHDVTSHRLLLHVPTFVVCVLTYGYVGSMQGFTF